MASKRHISFKWKLFLPVFICVWTVIIGALIWQFERIRQVRDEMALDTLSVIGARMVELYETGDTTRMLNFGKFANKFYDDSENYDPLNIWVTDITTDSVVYRVGTNLLEGVTLPKKKNGLMTVEPQFLNDDFLDSDQFLYSVHASPSTKKRVYVMLPYTKRMQDIITSKASYFWLLFVAIGVLVSIISYVTAAYFGRSVKLLKNFASKISNKSNYMVSDEVIFPHNELGDISRDIIKIYNQRAQEVEKRDREHKVALNAVEEKERIKRELTGNINHELKTPVGVIKGYIDTMVDDKDMDAETRQRFLLKAQQNVDRLSVLINDITAITKLESGGKLVNIQEVNFTDLAFAFANYVDEAGVLQDKMTFTYDMPLNCMVLGNASLLNTVLLNFVKNSVAYSEGTICRLLLNKQDEDFYYFTYYDNGIGVAAEHLPHMFERFFRVNTSRSRNSGGTGLGLAIVEVTIKSLGGEIKVSNHFPTGLEFDFSLPKYKKPVRSSEEGSEDSQDSVQEKKQ